MHLSLATWLLAFTPIAVLILGILMLKWEAAKVGAVTWLIATVIALLFFGADGRLLALANSKGLSLALYVILIIWGAVFLYNIAEQAGAIKVISNKMVGISDDSMIQCLLFAWCFAPVLQGLAGFGIPVAVVAPIMVMMGFEPLIAVAACLIGHSWSISFGSMGSSYNSIQLVTGIPGEIIGPWMAVIFSIAIFATGFGVAHIYGGWAAVKKALGPVFTTGVAMSFSLWFMNICDMAQLSTLIAGMCGCLVMILWAFAKKRRPAHEIASVQVETETTMGFHTACSPYYALIMISVILQIKPVKAALANFNWGLTYPRAQTTLGYVIEGVEKYSKIQWFSHPAPILFVSALIGIIIYLWRAKADKGMIKAAVENTVKKCIPMSVGIMTMVMMALVMSDFGMTNLIAQGVAAALGGLYPLAAPFIGVLGSFITGSNTNSNIMFGILQMETAMLIGKSSVLMAAVQSVGGSLGVSMAPSTIMIGSANVGLSGQENTVMGKTIKYCLINAALVGLFVFILDLLVPI